MSEKIIRIKPKFKGLAQSGGVEFEPDPANKIFNRVINKGDVFPVKESVVQMLLETGNWELAEGGE